MGILSPSSARIGTTIIVVRLPGTPPMQCLSATTGPECELLAGGDHRERVVSQFSQIKLLKGTPQHEHRKLDARITPRRDVRQDRIEILASEAFSSQLGPDQVHAGRRDRETRPYCGALSQAKIVKCFLRDSDLVGFEQAVAAHVEDAGDFALFAGFAIDAEDACPIERVQSQVTISQGVLVNEDHVLAQRIERQMSQPKGRHSFVNEIRARDWELRSFRRWEKRSESHWELCLAARRKPDSMPQWPEGSGRQETFGLPSAVTRTSV